jgi:ferrous iron transport protein A
MLLPLDMLQTGETAEIAEITGDPGWVGRLADLGLRQGCRLQVLQPGSPCLVLVGGCKLCLRGDDSSQILARPVLGG